MEAGSNVTDPFATSLARAWPGALRSSSQGILSMDLEVDPAGPATYAS
jgi:hypothetical protein